MSTQYCWHKLGARGLMKTLEEFQRRLHCAHTSTDEIIEDLYWANCALQRLRAVIDDMWTNDHDLTTERHGARKSRTLASLQVPPNQSRAVAAYESGWDDAMLVVRSAWFGEERT